MSLRMTRALTPARVVALVVMAVLVAGLVHLRVQPDRSDASVPDGAKAGDLSLAPCEFPTEAGAMAADCGTLVVPENNDDPSSKLIALPVVRIHGRSVAPGAEPIFSLGGGPGLSNMSFDEASRFVQHHDLVLVGYRGVDGSVRLGCPEVTSAVQHEADALSPTSFQVFGYAFRRCADRLMRDGIDVTRYGLPQQVDDMEAARAAMGYPRIDLLSQGAGTRTAMIYAWRFPDRIRRSVMIGVNPPGNFLWNPKTTRHMIGRYSRLCATDASCRARTDNLGTTMHQVAADLPSHWIFLPIQQSNVLVSSFFGLTESSDTAAPNSAPRTIDAWSSAAEGDPSGLWLESFLSELMPIQLVWGQYAAAEEIDRQTATAYFTAPPNDPWNLGYAGSAYSWGGGTLASSWPRMVDEDTYDTERLSDVDTLLISGQLDVATPPQTARREVLPFLAYGHQVVLPGIGHVASFFDGQPDAGSHLINTFLDSGRVDASRYHPQQVDLTPSTTLPTYAKRLLSLLITLIVLASTLMIGTALWVRRRGRLGRLAGGVLRSLGPLLLGLGGWALGVLIAYTTMPGVYLNDPLLVTVSAGTPIGLGVFLAWSNRGRPEQVDRAGFWVAVAGALLGGWFGLFVVEPPAAVLTAIIGAGVGANLGLLVLDLAGRHTDGASGGTVGMTSAEERQPESPPVR